MRCLILSCLAALFLTVGYCATQNTVGSAEYITKGIMAAKAK